MSEPRDDSLETVLDKAAEFGGFVAEQRGLARAVDKLAEEGEVERFLDEIERTVLEGGAGGGDVAVGSDHDGLGVWLEPARGLEDHEAGVGAVGGGAVLGCAGGHAEVRDDGVEGAAGEFVHGAVDGVDDGADVPGLAEGVGHDVGVLGLILDNEDLACGGGVCHGGIVRGPTRRATDGTHHRGTETQRRGRSWLRR